MKYRPEIDGLRALAVLPVIFFHAGFQTFGGGFIGVDVFFVISGYLITSIILYEKGAGTFSLRNFYERRARRILPPLFVIMLFCLLFAPLLMPLPEMKDFFHSLIAVSIFASNFLFWKQTGYFDSINEVKPLLHTWSLAIEEQYYLLFPVFLLLVWSLGKRRIVGIFSFGALISLAIAQWASLHKPTTAFYLLPTRGWELLIGVLVAFYLFEQDKSRRSQTELTRGRRHARQFIPALGLGLIAYAVFAFDRSTPVPGIYTLIPVAGTVLIILFADAEDLIGKLLGSRILVGIGLISYSAYLWHQPLFAFARIYSLKSPSASLLIFLSILALALAYLSRRFVELPFRDKQKIRGKTLFVSASVTTSAFICFGYIGTTNGFENVYNKTYIESLTQTQRHYYSLALKALPIEMGDNGDCHFHTNIPNDKDAARLDDCYQKYGKAIVVFGDSHAMDLYEAIASTTESPFVLGVSQPACRPHTPNPECHFDRIRKFFANKHEEIARIIYEQAGFYLVRDVNGADGRRDMFYRPIVSVYRPNKHFISEVVAYLGELAKHSEVVWLGPRLEPYIQTYSLMKVAINCSLGQFSVNPNVMKNFVQLDSYLRDYVSKSAKANGVAYVSQIDAVGFNAKTDLYGCGVVYWRDFDHWSEAGARRFGRRLTKALELPTLTSSPHPVAKQSDADQ